MRIFKIALLVLFAASTVLGTTSSATAAVPCTPKGIFQDDNPSFRPNPGGVNISYHNDNWTQATGLSGPFNGTSTFGDSDWASLGLAAEAKFTLNCVDGFRFYYAKADNRTKAKVYSNGVLIETVDQYAPSPIWRQYTEIDLPPGINNITIRASGSKNPSSKDYYLDIDGILPY